MPENPPFSPRTHLCCFEISCTSERSLGLTQGSNNDNNKNNIASTDWVDIFILFSIIIPRTFSTSVLASSDPNTVNLKSGFLSYFQKRHHTLNKTECNLQYYCPLSQFREVLCSSVQYTWLFTTFNNFMSFPNLVTAIFKNRQWTNQIAQLLSRDGSPQMGVWDSAFFSGSPYAGQLAAGRKSRPQHQWPPVTTPSFPSSETKNPSIW